VIAPETCDDENTNADDGCSAICTTEAGFTCTGNPSTCAEEGATSVCGDETVNEGEQCDDSNTISGDGCSGTETSAPNGACQNEFCGDGFVDTDGFGGDLTTIEQCDDGGVCQGGSNDGNPCTKFLDDSACGESGTCMKVNSVACSSTCTLPTP
jgi:cysteine-rich repeat protein